MTQPPPPPPNQPPNQPPQPPNQPPNQPPSQPPQPPQGGFGPPQAAPQGPPPPPGYGYPQAPPAGPTPPPGYGFPQSPPAPPQPGYGYPGQQPQPQPQPNPYATAPQNPYAPQPGPGYGYGYPTQPQFPGAPGMPLPPGGPKKSKAPLAIIVSAVVVIALIVGGGILYSRNDDGAAGKKGTASSGGTGKNDSKGGVLSGGSEKVPSDTESKVLFQVPMPETDDTVVTAGSWLTDTVYAKTGIAEITGYDPAKGTKKWTLKLSGPVCETTDHVDAEGRTAVLFQPKMPAKNSSAGCSQIAAIDLKTGSKLWTKTVDSGDSPISFSNITLGGGAVAVGSTYGGAAFDVASGKALWSPKPADTCYDAGYAGGAKLVAVRKCGEYGSRQLHIQNIDPKSGKVIAEYKMTQGIEYASVVSADPLVVAADVGDSAGDGSGISDFFSIDNKTGTLRAHISAPGAKYAARCDGITRIEECKELAVGNDKLYVPTEEHDGSGQYSKTNEIVAFDLATGKQTGQRADAGDGYNISPLRVDGTNLLAYKRPPYDKGGQVVSVDGSTFKQTVLLENPATESVRDAETAMLPEFAELLYGKGRLYMSAVYGHKSSSSYSSKEYLAIAFGTGD
ncbi:outer membrane protein assembly factor BamB family protein [Streptomyces sp. YIM S03343]